MSSLAPPPIPGIPGPRGSPVVGSWLAFARGPIAFLHRLQQTHGDLVQFVLPPYRLLFVNDPALIDAALVEQWRSLHKDDMYELLRPLLGDGLLLAEGERWRRNRRLVAPAFTPRAVEAQVDAMQQAVDAWIDGLAPVTELDLHREMQRLTQQVVLRALFGALDVEVDVDVVGASVDVVLQEFEAEVQGHRRLWPRGWPSRGRRRYARAVAALDEVVAALIAARRRQGLGGDVLSQLIEARDEAGGGLDDTQLRDEVITLFAAGHETTASVLTYALALLAENPDEQERLADDPSRAKWVMAESMRMLPPAWTIGREVVEPIELGGHTIPVGTQLMICQAVLHRDPRWYPQPDRFDPDRWTRGEARPRSAFLPFGAGPRICVGNHFALREGEVALAAMARAFRVDAMRASLPPLIPSVTLRPSASVWVRVTRR